MHPFRNVHHPRVASTTISYSRGMNVLGVDKDLIILSPIHEN